MRDLATERAPVTTVTKYFVAALAFAALLGLSYLSRVFWKSGFDTTTLIILAMIASAWYGGAGPGLLVAVLFEVTLDYYAWPPKDPLRFAIIVGNRVVLFGSLVLFASSRRIAERRLEQQERKLAESLAAERAARIDAEAASRAKDEFLANVSHELRTPLTSILGWATMLRRFDLRNDVTVDAGVQMDAIESIERNARAQARVIDNLLDLSALVVSGAELARRPLSFGELVRRAADEVGSSPEAADRELRVSIAETPAILGDADRMAKAVEHLLTNAVKFTAPGGVVDVHVEVQGEQIQLRVQDSGIGMHERTMANLFQPFWQADRSGTHPRAGLGVGLAIVRHIVALHGGTVTAASEGPGRGAAFTISLPAFDDTAPPQIA